MDPLDPPNPPFAKGSRPTSTHNNISSSRNDADRAASLSVNYVPSKFSSALVTTGVRHRRHKGKRTELMPKRGGGREAFKKDEARMPGEGDDDYDGIDNPLFGNTSGGHTKPRMRWNRFKWILFLANVTVCCCTRQVSVGRSEKNWQLTTYTLIALIFCLLTWFNVFTHADILHVGNRPELILSTIAASLGLVSALVGWPGILLNNRSFLAVYTFMLWICFALLLAPGYIAYLRKHRNLEGKIGAQWSRDFGPEARLRVQNQLQCCGYFSPFVEAAISQTCYARSMLPGCKKPYLTFERLVLTRWYTVAFAIAPFHIAIMVVGLLCSNHITYRFGKGMMPKPYRLSMRSMAVIMDNYAQCASACPLI